VTGAGRPIDFIPFAPEYRASGVLYVSSLPSPYGIGDLGPAALATVDRLHAAGQGWWQALPLGPTGYGNSPYQCLSSFAGNGLLISPNCLFEEGLLRAGDCDEGSSFPALIHNHFSARQGVEADHMNMLCMGGRTLGPAVAWNLVQTFLAAESSQAERHLRRLGKVSSVEGTPNG
jgi:4-alpha-glucanotransferase/Ribose/Galactose Isomerase